MDKLVNDFLNFQDFVLNTDTGFDESVLTDLDISKSIIQILGCGIYMVDFVKEKIVLISENITEIFGTDSTSLNIKDFESFVKHIPSNEYNQLVEVNKAIFEFLKKKPDNEIIKYSVSYNFHIENLLLHQIFKPVEAVNGFITTGINLLTISSEKDFGHVIMQKTKDFYYEYSFDNHNWIHKKSIRLTEIEKLILSLSAQGRTIEDIADVVCKSPSCVKVYKKHIWDKMGVENNSEALVYAVNNRFF